MAEEVLLSDLCSICHLEHPKYTCPGCKIKTCSVACVKRHKARSQCSGLRNSAPYRKRNELATASSMDQDFNFISRLERNVDRMAGKTQDLGLTSTQRPTKRPKWDERRDSEIQKRGPNVIKAPAGLTRARQNLSRWDNQSQCLIWTVEWVFEDGSKAISACQETQSVKEAFKQMESRRKRKTQQSGTGVAADTKVKAPSDPVATSSTSTELGVHFYLHRPDAPANIRCVIPIQPETTIKESIEKRTIVEFPTIYVLSVEQVSLPAPFMTEEQHLRKFNSQNAPPLSMAPDLSQADNNEKLPEIPTDPTISDAQIAEVLLKDIGDS